MLLAIAMQDQIAHSELSRIHFDKRPLSMHWNDVPVSQCVRYSLFTISERNCDLLGHCVRFLSFMLHLFAMVVLVGDSLSAGLVRLGVDDENFIAKLDLRHGNRFKLLQSLVISHHLAISWPAGITFTISCIFVHIGKFLFRSLKRSVYV